jgi:hypothetical protein
LNFGLFGVTLSACESKNRKMEARASIRRFNASRVAGEAREKEACQAEKVNFPGLIYNVTLELA